MTEVASAITHDAEMDVAPQGAASSSPASLTWMQLVVAWSAALLLLAAAVLKAWPMATGQAIDTQAAGLGKLILIQGEIVLALWLISGIHAAWAFRAAMVFFAGAACVNLRSIWLGEVSCGCFGQLRVNPWLSLFWNVTVIALLIGSGRKLLWNSVSQQKFRSDVFQLLKVVAGVVLILLVIGLCLFLAIPDPIEFIRNARGESLSVEPAISELGEAKAGTLRTFVVTLRNNTDSTIMVTGGTATCSCMTINNLPLSIPAHDSKPIEVLMSFRPGPTSFRHVFRLYTDDQREPVVFARFDGTLTE